jgi:hypothetical protein
MPQKDPNRLLYWILVVICLIGILPVFFLGSVEPLVFGIPLWVAVSLISTCVLTVITLIQMLFGWSSAQTGSEVNRSSGDE